MVSEELRQLIKIDLHCHLDGSLSVDTIREVAQDVGIVLPAKEQLKELLQVPEHCESLKEYLTRFDLPLQCLCSEKSFEKAAFSLIKDIQMENVAYIEVRFAPQLSVKEGLSCRQIIEAVICGLKRGEAEYGVKSNVILCAMRHMPVEENLAMLQAGKEFFGAGVCGFDLAGDEAGFPVLQQRVFFEEVRRMGIPFTIHAGECGSAQSISDAIDLGARRIGHGIAAIKDPKVMELCKEKKIALEMCPVSNLDTKAALSMEEYPFWKFYQDGMTVTVNTDNRTVSNTNLTREFALLQQYYSLTVADIRKLTQNAIEASFAEDAVKHYLLKQIS